MQNIRIATLLKDKWELIVHSWAVEIRHTIDDYKTRPIDELLHTTGAHLDAIIELLETDSNAKLRKFMNNIAPLRMTQHFKLSDIQRAFLIGRRVILSLAEKEYGGNSEEFCAARAAIEEPFTLTLLEYSDIYQQLQVDRNHNWMPHIESLLQTPEVEFVLVGALHLAGKDGLLHLLREKGYQVRYQ